VEYKASEPMMPLHFFKIRNFMIACAMGFVSGVAMFVIFSFLPLYFQNVKGLTATESGLHAVPLMATVILASSISGGVISKTGKYRALPVIGGAIMTLGVGLMGLITAEISYGELVVFMCLIGIGVGQVLPTLSLVAQNSVPYKDMAAATALLSFVRNLGGALGVAIYGAVLTDALANNLPDSLHSLVNVAPEEVRILLQVSQPATYQIFLDAYAKSLATLFLWAAPPCGLAFLLAFFIQHIELRGSKPAASASTTSQPAGAAGGAASGAPSQQGVTVVVAPGAPAEPEAVQAHMDF